MAEAITLTGRRRRLVEIDALVALGWLAGRPSSGVFRIGSAIASAPQDSEHLRLAPRTWAPLDRHTCFASGDPLAAIRPKEREHVAPSLARSSARGSAGHRFPPKYLYWPEMA